MTSPRKRPPTPAELHRSWLELVDTDGPFLAIPPLKRVWPHGMPALADDRLDALREAKPAFDHAWEALDKDPDDETVVQKYREVRDGWVQTVLGDVVGWRELLAWGAGSVPGVAATSPDRRVTVMPAAAIVGPDGAGALVSVVDACDSLREASDDGWAASPIDRMETMLRGSGVPIGIVTDGRWWALICAREGVMVASGVVDALTWTEEPLVRNAFLTVIARQYLVGGAADERLPVLFEESVAAAEEITEALGKQVRRAVELLVQAFADTAAEARRRGQPDPLPAEAGEIYSAAVTVMMRVVFLLFAEERGLLPQGRLFQQGYGVSGELDTLLQRELVDGTESLDSTFMTWHRLLATGAALHGGASFEDIRMPAYGGSLFDPTRYAFLTASTENGTLALPISDRVMRHVLRSVQFAQLVEKQDARRISFRDIDVEQIGYIYEGLLGYTCKQTNEIALGLVGSAGAEPEIPLAQLEQLADKHRTPAELAKAIIAWAEKDQPSAKAPTANQLAKLLAATPNEDADRQLRAITADDDELRARLLRWEPVIRRDLRNRPSVVLAGGLLVAETPSRKNTGTHYTPRDLAENIVNHALEPLCYRPGPHQTADRDQWKPISSTEILALKVADIACGSGAFLVAAARYLAARLVEAWREDTPELARRKDVHLHAVRDVIAHCLYGADINAMALEMCKLSLWLVSLDPKLPFSFVDDKILHGNSLLGLTDLKQLRALHIDPPTNYQPRLTTADDPELFRRAIDLRRDLATEVSELDPHRSTTAKARQLDRFHNLTQPLREAADAVIAAGLRLGGKPGKALNEAYEDLAEAAAAALSDGATDDDREMFDSIVETGLTPTVPTDYLRWKPLHWALEVPDVIVDHGGFDAIVGNPPFLGGQKLTGALGTNMRDWSVHQVAGGQRGSADLVAYFLLRAFDLIRPTGTLGLIATNTVAQRDTRQVGLARLEGHGFTITRAIQSEKWPSESANLEFAAVWGTREHVHETAARVADDLIVPYITPLLEGAKGPEPMPQPLPENKDVAFQGCIVVGMGFVLDSEEAHAWIDAADRNREVLFPYLNGEDVNSRPDCSPSRWVIDFFDRSETESAVYELPFARLRQTVYEERQRVNRKALRERWWQYGEKRPGLRRAIAGLAEMLVITRHSRTVMPVRVTAGMIPSEATVVFATDSYGDQAALSSSLHQTWSIKYGGGLRTDPRYASEVFEMFPRPQTTDRMAAVGTALDRERREIMIRRNLGLTDLYNLVNDPSLADSADTDVARMRRIHAELDEAVVAAYGWSSVPLDHRFHTYHRMTRWTISPEARVELMDRLLQENLRRAAAQAQPKKATKARRRSAGPVEGQEAML